ncbi:MAG: hypothetical protein M3277_11130 [Actinomycetota bacterium]|nr:hypothetical protein [Actinomycetota bacterium]
MTTDSLRRCLTALIVVLAIGVGPGVSQAVADHAAKDPGSEDSARCERHRDHGDEDPEDAGEKGKGCRDEGHDDKGHDDKSNDGKGKDGTSNDDKGHDDQGHDDQGHDDNGHAEGHEDESHDRGKDQRSGPDDDGEDDGGEEPEVRRTADGRGADGRLGVGGRVAPPSPTPSETPNGPSEDSLDLTVGASRVVARVGDEIDYTITVTNTGGTELADVTVVDLVPPELDVVSVPLAEGVEAAQAGRSPQGEDVVWILEALLPRVSVELSWTGIVRLAGDLEATNVVTASTQDLEARASVTTFLAAATGVTAQKTAPEVMPKRIVNVTRVPATPGPGAPLPVTALAVEWLVALALAIVFAGMVLLILGRPPLSVGRGSAYALALLAVVYAATFINDASTIPEPRPSETVEDEVKGKRIFNNEDRPSPSPKPEKEGRPPADSGAGAVAAPAEEPAAEEPAEDVVVRTVRTVKVPVDATAIESGGGANVVGFSWAEPTRTILQATSSLGPIARVAPYELHTSLGMAGDTLQTTLVLRNLSDGLIAVSGLLMHDVQGAGISLTLKTSQIDVILRRHGEIRATFEYLLPSGDYRLGARFVAG